ncbi:aminoglycoside N(3)-acetyltransferase [Haloglomus litoreum]|uniref:aminoglycoside N(3)-acetyltransferase n=1 Tax=Haloglomus litoreum TaxID=3034026 RepID=UPI0023E8F0AE|nr:AAC(3) family N-acetyltransferase [Haloglomus sp. DT116]
MGEQAALERVAEPVTVDSLVAELRDLGVEAGETLLVHSSLSALGWVAGDAQAVVDALRRAVTEEGTLVMPTHTPQYTDPADWSNPPVPDDWIETIRRERPAYHPRRTPTRGMGAIPECFRAYPDVRRSAHPIFSFAAWGAGAAAVVGDHGFAYGMGEGSPLARVYERDGDVLLLGVGHDVNTSLHLAEYRADIGAAGVTREAPVLRDGERVVETFEDIETSTGDFATVGGAFEDQRPEAVTRDTVGAAGARLVDQPSLVDFAVDWFERHRTGDGGN